MDRVMHGAQPGGRPRRPRLRAGRSGHGDRPLVRYGGAVDGLAPASPPHHPLRTLVRPLSRRPARDEVKSLWRPPMPQRQSEAMSVSDRLRRLGTALREFDAEVTELHERQRLLNRPWEEEFLHWAFDGQEWQSARPPRPTRRRAAPQRHPQRLVSGLADVIDLAVERPVAPSASRARGHHEPEHHAQCAQHHEQPPEQAQLRTIPPTAGARHRARLCRGSSPVAPSGRPAPLRPPASRGGAARASPSRSRAPRTPR